jgi:hypothetical protein
LNDPFILQLGKDFQVCDVFEGGVIQHLRQNGAGNGHKGDGEGMVEFSEIKDDGFMGNRGDEELGREAIKKKNPKIFAFLQALRAEPDDQQAENEGNLEGKKKGLYPRGIFGIRITCQPHPASRSL